MIKTNLFFFVIFVTCFAEAILSCRYSISQMVYQDNEWFHVVVPTDQGFEFKQTKSPLDVQKILDSVPLAHQQRVEEYLNQVASHYSKVVDALKPLALKHQALLKFRLKDQDSLRNKIKARAQEYPSSFGRLFHLSDLHDLIGARIIVQTGSPLHRFTDKAEFWAEKLNIQPEQILEVEIKGKEKDCQKGKCYRAAHLVIQLFEGVRFELQIHSKVMNYWHRWDHKNVYKNTQVTNDERNRLKQYSLAWVKTIRALEDIKMGHGSLDVLRELHPDVGFDFSWNSWPAILDQHLTRQFNIPYQQRFLIEVYKKKSIEWYDTNRLLIRELSQLTLLKAMN